MLGHPLLLDDVGQLSARGPVGEDAGVQAEQGHGNHVVRRHVGREPLPSHAWSAAVTASMAPEDGRTDEQRESLALAVELAGELREADAVLLAVPLYNFGISQHVKTWVDLVIAGAAPGTRLLEGVPVVLTLVRGGAYGEGTPREGWDHSTAYLLRILEDVWGAQVTVVEREFTLVGVNPALDEFTDLAHTFHEQALTQAEEVGRSFARGDEVAQAS